MWIDLQERFLGLWADARIRAGLIVIGSVLSAYLIELVVRYTLGWLASKTRTDLDDKVVSSVRRPIFLTVLFAGLAWAMASVVDGLPRFLVYSCLKTMTVLAWAGAAFKIGMDVIETLSARSGESSIVQPRTVPLFDMMIKIVVIGAAVYFALLSWDIDVTAWLASAGIVGIAVGFAAKDSLANLIAGIFILADAPYKVGDFIVLDGSLRGQVTRIGIRSTRILTLDDVEITVPNAVIGNAKILNEAGGPTVKQRIRIQVSAAYTSDVDQVAEVLRGCARGVPELCQEPRPDVQFRSFGASGLDFELLVWITDAAARDRIISKLNMIVFKRFGEAGIEIPYSKHDLYIKEMPAGAQEE